MFTDLVGNQSRADNSSFPIRDSAGFFHITSPVYSSDNRTYVEQEELRMHMIIIDSGEMLEATSEIPHVLTFAVGNTYTPLCMRVNSSVDANSIATGANAGSALSLNSWLLLAGGFVALAYAL